MIHKRKKLHYNKDNFINLQTGPYCLQTHTKYSKSREVNTDLTNRTLTVRVYLQKGGSIVPVILAIFYYKQLISLENFKVQQNRENKQKNILYRQMLPLRNKSG